MTRPTDEQIARLTRQARQSNWGIYTTDPVSRDDLSALVAGYHAERDRANSIEVRFTLTMDRVRDVVLRLWKSRRQYQDSAHDSDLLWQMQAKILDRVCVALKGPHPPMGRHSLHDLGELTEQLRDRADERLARLHLAKAVIGTLWASRRRQQDSMQTTVTAVALTVAAERLLSAIGVPLDDRPAMVADIVHAGLAALNEMAQEGR